MIVPRRNRPTIGVLAGWQVYSGTIDTFLEHVIRGIQTAAKKRGCNLLLACSASMTGTFFTGRNAWPFVHEQVDFLPTGPWNCDGLIIIPPMPEKSCEEYAVELAASGFPVVFAGVAGFTPCVGIDNRMGIRQAVQHLVAHGHRRIAYIAGFENHELDDSAIRLNAYREVIAELGIPFDPKLVAYGSHSRELGQLAMQQILALGVPFSAVVGSNDLSAMGAIDALHQAGLSVPNQVAVIGFDNRVETYAIVPPLTTIHYPMFEQGYQALEMLLDQIESGKPSHELRLISSQLIPRDSCGCQPGKAGKIGPQVSEFVSPQLLPSGSGGDIEAILYATIQAESHRIPRSELAALTQRCVKSFRASLSTGDPQVFINAFQAILDQVSQWQDNLFIWQNALTILRQNPPLGQSPRLDRATVDNLLDQARIIGSETARSYATRQLILQTQVAEILEVMTNAFFAAQDEDEIFNIVNRSLPTIGIEQTAVCYYQSRGEDPVGWSILQTPHPTLEKGFAFDTRQFPPPGLFPDDSAFQVAVLPLSCGQKPNGYVAMKIGPLESLADIVRQLGSSLYAVRLRQEALAAQSLAEEANQLKSRFLSMVSHELRAPLNLISGLSDIILKDKTTGQMSTSSWEDLERIYISAQHLDGLIQDVLDLARSDIGQLKLTCEPLELRGILDSVAMICTRLVSDKGLAWYYEVPDSLPQVWGDRTRLRQVVLNLVNNAVKFTDRGEVALSASVTTQQQVVISVRDTGLGIPLDEQEIIFEEFRQSGRTAARGYGGLGLGLAICKRLVEMHGGEISVHSTGRKDKGACFTVMLPAMDTHMPPVPQPAKAELAACVFGLVKDQASGEILRNYLVGQGHTVELHLLGERSEWLSWLLTCNPDVVVMDLGMTSERGWEVLKTIKENPATTEIPVLFYTLSKDEQSGALLDVDFLTKPVKSSALAESLLIHHISDHARSGETDLSVMIVDDDPGTVDLHTRLVRQQFPLARISQANDGRTALELIRRNPPTLVLLDLLMPEMDGFAVLAEMREDKRTRDVPVIVITNQNLDQQDIARLNRGVVSILGKNIFSTEETLEHISSFLKTHHKQGSDVQQAILKAMAFIHNNFKEPISRGQIAASVGLSERHLDRCFQQGLGISPMTYLNRYRVFQARNLLDTQSMGITAVAMEVGFSSSGYFARVFRNEMGISPRDYLQNRKGKP